VVRLERVSYLVVILMVIAGGAFGQAYFSVNGWDVEARVDTVNGHFGVGQHSTSYDLTYEFRPHILVPSPSSNVVFRIDGETYAWNGAVTGFDYNLYPLKAPTFPRLLIATNQIQNRWLFPLPGGEQVQIDQFLQPTQHLVTIVDDGDTTTDTLGLIKVTYRVTNNGGIPHAVGVEHKWDIYINGVDGAPVSIPGTFSATNQVYAGDHVPPSFLAAQIDLLDPDIDQLVASGLLRIADATKPDLLAYGNEEDLLYSCFDLDTASFATGTYSNTAALLRWDARTVPPGHSFDLVTYYGLGSILAQRGEINLAISGSNWDAVACTLAGNPKAFTAIFQNSSSDLTTFDTLWLCVNFDSSMAEMVIDPDDVYADELCFTYLDVGMAETGTQSWLFNALSGVHGSFCLFWACSVSTPGIEPVFDTTCWDIPYISGIGPTVEFLKPLNSYTACNSGDGLEAWILFDKTIDEIPFRFERTRVRIDVADTFAIVDFEYEPAFIWGLSPDNLTDTLKIPLDSLPELEYSTGDSIIVCVTRAEDVHGCTGDYVCDTIIVDQDPPVLWTMWPSPGSEIPMLSPLIQIGLVDSVSGLDTMNIFYRVNGIPYRVSAFGGAYYNVPERLVFHTPPVEFPSETWVTVCVDSVSDRTDDICGPNWLRDTCWTFFVDNTPPTVELASPSNLSIISCNEPIPMVFHVHDSLCVDSTSGIVQIIPGPTIDLSSTSYDIEWFCDSFIIHDVMFSHGPIRVDLSGIRDEVGNEIVPITYTFIVDTLGPLPNLSSISPPHESWVSPAFMCSIMVIDESPLDESSLLWRFRVGGFFFTYDFFDVNTRISSIGTDSWLSYSNALMGFPVSHGDTVQVCLMNISDVAELCEPNYLVGAPVCWEYYIDAMGPEATLNWPAHQSISGCYPLSHLDVIITDPSEVDPTTVIVEVNGTLKPVTVFGDTFRVFIAPTHLPPCPDTVFVNLIHAEDSLGNMTTDSSWWFILDTIPPFSNPSTWYPVPDDPIIAVSPFDTIRYQIEPGCLGSFSRRYTLTELFVRPSGERDSIWGNDDRVVWEDDWWNLPINHLDYIMDADTVCVKISHLRDSLDYMSHPGCDPAFAEDIMAWEEWCFRVSAGGPMMSRRYPQRCYLSCFDPPNGFRYRVYDEDGLDVETIRFLVNRPGFAPTEYTWPHDIFDTTWVEYPSELFVDFRINIRDFVGIGDSLCVEFNRIQDLFGIHNEGVSRFCVVVDTTAPCPLEVYPDDVSVGTRTPLIWAIVPPDIAPILGDSLAFSLNGGTDWIWATDPTGAVYWGDGDTAFLDVGLLHPSMWISGGDTVDVCIKNTDNTDTLVGCPLNTCMTCWSFWLEASGPVPMAISPGEGWIWACPTVDSMFVALEDPDGINWSTVEVRCSSYVYGDVRHYSWPSPNLSNRPETLIITPTPPYADQDTIQVEVWASDNLMNPIDDEPYTYFFIIDHTPPDTIWTTPSCAGDSISDNAPTIWFHARDAWGRVDTLSWCVAFRHPASPTDWETICYDDAPGAWVFAGTADSVGLNTGLVGALDPWWIGGDTVVFTVVSVCDETDACGPNCATTVDTCYLSITARGPDVTNIWPGGNGIIGCEQPDTFVFRIYDADGVDATSMTLWYGSCSMDTTAFVIGDPEIVDYRYGINTDTVYFVPPEVLAEGCWFNISIDVLDAIGNPAELNSFDFVYDYTPPDFVIVYPFDSAFSFSPDIIMAFPDNIAGIDTLTVTVSITGGPCAFVSATSPAPDTLEWRFADGIPETLIFSMDALDCDLRRGDSVCVHVDMACDFVADCPACTTYDTTWCFEIVQGGPEPELVHPTGLLCPEDEVIIFFDDPDGVVIDDLEFTVNGVVVPYPGAEFTWDAGDFLLTYLPDEPFDETNVRICVDNVEDELGYAMRRTCWDLIADLAPPLAEYISPTGIIEEHQPDIVIEVWDSLNFVNPDCFVLSVRGVIYSFDGTILSWTPEPEIATPGTLTWSAVLAGDTLSPGPVEVCLVEACDSTGCDENNMLSSLGELCWEFEIAFGDGPRVHIDNPTDCGLAISCDVGFQFRWSIDSEEPVNSTSIMLTYSAEGSETSYGIDDPELTLIGDSILTFDAPAPTAPGDIWVLIESMFDVLGNPAWGDLDTCRFVIDWDAPFVVDFSPEHESEVGTPYPLIWFLVDEATSIIDYSSVIFNIDGTSYGFADPHVYWSGDTVFFDPFIAPPTPFAGGDTIEFCIEYLADSTVICPPNALIDECYEFSVNADGPNLSLIFPDPTLDPMITFCDEGAFWIRTVDPERLDTAEVEVRWNGTTVRWEDSPGLFDMFPGGAGSDVDTVAVWPPFSTADGDTVCLTIVHWPDSIGNNYFGDITWCAVVDNSPPAADYLSPLPGEITDTWSPDVVAHLVDELSWVAHGSVRLNIEIDGDPWGSFPWGSPELSWSDDTLIFVTDYDFPEFAEICAYLRVYDSTTIGEPYNCPPNQGTIEWCWEIGDDDTIGPELIMPDSCYVRANYDEFFISVALTDPSGVYDDDVTVDTTGQGLLAQFFVGDSPPVVYWLPMSIDSVVEYAGPEGDSLYWASTVPGAIPGHEIVDGMVFGYVIWAHDNDFDFENPLDRQLSVSDTQWCVVFNDVPPEIVIDVAPHGSYVSCLCPDQSIELRFLDTDTLKSDLLELEVNGVVWTTASPQITWDPGRPGHHVGVHNLTYHPDPDDCWEHGETVEACIRGVVDQWGNAADEYCWEFSMDFFPPVAWCIDEFDTNVSITQFDSIVFHLDDENAGVNPYEIMLQVQQVSAGDSRVIIYDIASESALRYDAVNGKLILDLRYATGLDMSRDDSLFFSIVSARDLTTICPANVLEDHNMCVRYIKPMTECHASPQPFTPPPPADGFNDEVVFDFPGRIDFLGTVKIFDLNGRQVTEITAGPAHRYAWDGYDFNGVPARPGVYVYVIELGGEVICSGTVVLAR